MADPFKPDQSLFTDLIGPDLISTHAGLSGLVLEIYASSVPRALTILRDHKHCHYEQLVDIIGVDHPDRSQRFELIYSLLSHTENKRIFVKIKADEENPVPTISGVFPNAVWYEREVYDLYGVIFSDHPDLRRILTDYNFDGHPLRKDFPLTGYTQVYFDEDQHRVAYEPVNLQQDFRNFDFLSPWEGILNRDHMPKDEPETPAQENPAKEETP